MKLISLKNVSAGYDGKEVISNVNLDIYSRDFIGIIGPNGGGKTTLIKTILKTLPYSGKITYHSQHSDNQGIMNIGYMPQVSDIDKSFPISVREVVISGLISQKGFFGRINKEDKKKVDNILTRTGIANIAEKPIGEISGGQLQRSLLCRALISEPELLILDEPTNFVDNTFEHELYTILKQLNDKMAIIIVSHDLGTITSYVKSIVCVNKTVHKHNSNLITHEQLDNYNCPIQIISHGEIPHTVLAKH